MRIFIVLSLLFISALAPLQAHAQSLKPCGDIGRIQVDFSSPAAGAVLNPLTPPLVQFEIDRVRFTRVISDVLFNGNALQLNGGQPIGGTYFDAAVRIELVGAGCAICSIAMEMHPHGPEAVLSASGVRGPVGQDRVDGNNGAALVVTTNEDNPICSATISGQETEIFIVHIE